VTALSSSVNAVLVEDLECSPCECISCSPRAYRDCLDGAAYWYDSCGRASELIDACAAGHGCFGGECLILGRSCQCSCSCRSCTSQSSATCGSPSTQCGSCALICDDSCSECGGVLSYSGSCG
jgi:hypothetical protein